MWCNGREERKSEMRTLAQEIINGRRLTKVDDINFLKKANLKEVIEGANEIRKAFCGNRIDLCSIINGRAGKCSEDCKFCAQSAYNHTGCDIHDILDLEEILKDCKQKEVAGVNGYSIVTAGRAICGSDVDKIADIYQSLSRECNIRLCASMGLLQLEDLKKLKEAGVDRYHENLETSERYFPSVCTTHTYEDKIKAIKAAREAGLSVCSGGIIGMGETWEDRVDMALALSELQVKSIPINILLPVKGTPFENIKRLSEEEILRTFAMFRFINPEADIRIAAGRKYFSDGGKSLFKSGVNATITGDMLTTIGNNISQDIEMLTKMGFEMAVKKGNAKNGNNKDEGQ